jgi:hypothetical protein
LIGEFVLESLHFYNATGCSPLVYFRVKKCRKYNPDKCPMVILHKRPCDVDSGDIFRDVEGDISSDGCCQRAETILVFDASGLQISYSVSSREYESLLPQDSTQALSRITALQEQSSHRIPDNGGICCMLQSFRGSG